MIVIKWFNDLLVQGLGLRSKFRGSRLVCKLQFHWCVKEFWYLDLFPPRRGVKLTRLDYVVVHNSWVSLMTVFVILVTTVMAIVAFMVLKLLIFSRISIFIGIRL